MFFGAFCECSLQTNSQTATVFEIYVNIVLWCEDGFTVIRLESKQ